MPLTRQRLIDLLAIGRVANLPTVWSNVVVGFLIASSVTHGIRFPDPSFCGDLDHLLILLVATTCAYLFGTFLNDWKDSEFDRENRPERAIPSGRWSRTSIGLFALFLGSASLGGFAYLGLALTHLLVPILGVALLASILVYTYIHKKTPMAIVPMGLCRSLLYLLGFFSISSPVVFNLSLSPSISDRLTGNQFLVLLLMSMGILSYVAGLTLAARFESRPEQMRVPRAFLWFLIFLPFLTHTWWWIWQRPPFLVGWHLAIPVLLCLLPFLAWTTRALFVLKKSIPDFVSRALAGLCLLDLLAYAGIAATIHTGWIALDSAPLYLALIPLSCFIFALLLQRVAPAT